MKKRLHPDVIRLGIVSFLTDLSSEMVFSVFAVFFTTVIGATTAVLGLIEGLADFSSSSLDYVAGWLSDKYDRRKPFAMLGYGFSTLAKTMLVVADSVAGVGAFRVVERLGKSFRGPPRDAWLAAIATKKDRGYTFGVHKAFDKAGAVLGPLVAYGLLRYLGERPETFRLMFWIALVPATLSVLVLAFMKDRPVASTRRENLFAAFKQLSPQFKRYLVVAGVFALAYFSFSFLLLEAYDLEFSAAQVVLLYALFNLTFVVVSPWIGRLGDRIGRHAIIITGYLAYLVMCVGFLFAASPLHIVALFIVFGVFYAIDEAQTRAFVADLEPDRKATAIGAYNMVTGLLYIPASLIAGTLWMVRPPLIFVAAGGITLVAIVLFVALRKRM